MPADFASLHQQLTQPTHQAASHAGARLSLQAFERQRKQAYQAVTQSNWAKAEKLFSAVGDDPRLGQRDLTALATLRLRGGDFEGAWQAAGRVLESDPENVKAVQLATLALASLHRWAEALPFFERHNQGQARRDYAFVSNHGAALAALGRPQDALPVMLEAMALNLSDPAAHMKLAVVLRDMKLFEESAESFQTALTLDGSRLAAQLMVLHMRQHACRWQAFEETRVQLVAALENNEDPSALSEGGVFSLVAIEHPPELFLRATAHVAMRFEQCATPLAPRRLELLPDRRIRIGYVSNDFYNHATAALFVESLEQRDQSRFEITLYSHGPDDGSQLGNRIRAACEHVVDLCGISDAQAAARIRADGIDILVDLKGHTLGNRLGVFAWRPAPLQVSFLGFPGTSGADYIDYVIGDRWVTPLDHADRYSEKIAQMPVCYQPNDSLRQRPAARVRSEFGLPDDCLVFGCFNQAFKITPAVFDSWMRILMAIPDSVLWLLEDNAQATANLRREGAFRGIASERLVFTPRLPNAMNLARLPLADLMLDNWPCNAHTTASDILWMGVPLVTVKGEAFASRVAASLLASVGLEQLICDDAEAYEERVIELARNPQALRALREHLSGRLDGFAVFDGRQHAADLGALFMRMVDRAQQGLKPQALAASEPIRLPPPPHRSPVTTGSAVVVAPPIDIGAITQAKELTIVCVAYKRYLNLPVLIHSLLAQTLQNFRLIVIHDGHDAEMATLLKPFVDKHPDRIEVMFTDQRFNDYGHTLRDIGIRLADTEYVLLTNDDNYYVPRFLEYMFMPMHAQGQIAPDIVFCDMIHSHNNPGVRKQLPYNPFETRPERNFIDIGCFVARTELARVVGFRDKGFAGDATYFEDLVAAADDAKLVKIPMTLFVHN